MVFGPSKKEFEALEAENAYLKQWLEHAQVSDAVTLSHEIVQLKAEKERLDDLVRQALHDLEVARLDIVETREMALLQEAGIYEYRHPLEDAVTYQSALKELKDRIKATVSSGEAVAANTDWRVNNSLREGAKMVKDFSKLMLRAYNAEADNAVKTLKPYALESAKQRLSPGEGLLAGPPGTTGQTTQRHHKSWMSRHRR